MADLEKTVNLELASKSENNVQNEPASYLILSAGAGSLVGGLIGMDIGFSNQSVFGLYAGTLIGGAIGSALLATIGYGINRAVGYLRGK